MHVVLPLQAVSQSIAAAHERSPFGATPWHDAANQHAANRLQLSGAARRQLLSVPCLAQSASQVCEPR